MRGLNKVILIGHLGKDPEIQNFDNGGSLAKFSLATTEAYKDKSGQRVEQTEWHNIVIWGTAAEIAQKYLRKGSFVYIEGKIRNRSYDDKDGNKKYITEIRVDNFQMLDKKDGAAPSNYDNQKPQSDASPASMADDSIADDLPF